MNRGERRRRARVLRQAARAIATELVDDMVFDRTTVGFRVATFDGDHHISLTVSLDQEVSQVIAGTLTEIFDDEDDDEDEEDEDGLEE
jgi:hypothetical protein